MRFLPISLPAILRNSLKIAFFVFSRETLSVLFDDVGFQGRIGREARVADTVRCSKAFVEMREVTGKDHSAGFGSYILYGLLISEKYDNMASSVISEGSV